MTQQPEQSLQLLFIEICFHGYLFGLFLWCEGVVGYDRMYLIVSETVKSH